MSAVEDDLIFVCEHCQKRGVTVRQIVDYTVTQYLEASVELRPSRYACDCGSCEPQAEPQIWAEEASCVGAAEDMDANNGFDPVREWDWDRGELCEIDYEYGDTSFHYECGSCGRIESSLLNLVKIVPASEPESVEASPAASPSSVSDEVELLLADIP